MNDKETTTIINLELPHRAVKGIFILINIGFLLGVLTGYLLWGI